MIAPLLEWLVTSEEPWTRYRTMVDLLKLPTSDREVTKARAEMLSHLAVKALVGEVLAWPGSPLERHNDARHLLHKLGVLVDFGLTASDLGMEEVLSAIQSHISREGSLQTMIHMEWDAAATKGTFWTWMLCDAPVLLHAVIGLGGREQLAVAAAMAHLLSLSFENGWRCTVSPELGKFRGPGRKGDPCPIANVFSLEAISFCPDLLDHPAAQNGVEMLLSHWVERHEQKFYMFGMGTDFGKLKYPFIWYDVLHVVDLLSRFPYVHSDSRFGEMLSTITAQANESGQYTAGSMYQVWKNWSFADKKRPSPWLTVKVLQVLQRVGREQTLKC